MFKKRMKKSNLWFGIFAATLVLALVFVSCKDDDGGFDDGNDTTTANLTSAKFIGYDRNGNKYELAVSQKTGRSVRAITDLMPGDNYTLTIYFADGTVLATSSGEVMLTGSGKIKLKHKNGEEFEVDVNDNKIVRIVIDYDIPLDDGGKLKPPEEHLRDDDPNNDNNNSGGSSVTGVSLIPPFTTLIPGWFHPLTAVITPSNAANKNMTWSSSDSSVATIRNGIVTAIAPGSATIRVTTDDGGFTAECVVTVPASIVCNHIWGNWEQTTAPTCISSGVERRFCQLDRAHYETRTGAPALGHSWGAWTVTTPATAINDGVETRTCANCGDSETRSIPAGNFIVRNTAEWNSVLSAIRGNGNNKAYTITISPPGGGTILVPGIPTSPSYISPDYNYSFGTVTGITVTLKGTGKLKLDSQGTILYVSYNQKLVIDSSTLTLEGLSSAKGDSQDNSTALIEVYGILELKAGTITGNTGFGGGVSVTGGTFIISGGEISYNTTSSGYTGGGVNVSYNTASMTNGTIIMSGGKINNNEGANAGGIWFGGDSFTMSGGEIRNNKATNMKGGGISVVSGVFTMSGGEISGNPDGGVNVSGGGTFNMIGGKISGNARGGVYVTRVISTTIINGIFTMSGGEISSNTNNLSSGGGGVSVQGGDFTMTGGEIKGNTNESGGGGVGVASYSDTISTFTKTGGTIYGNDGTPNKNQGYGGGGHAVFWQQYDSYRYCNTTLGPTDNISTAVTTSPPWSM